MNGHIAHTTDYSGRQVDVELLQSIAKPVDIERVSLSSITKPAKIVAGIQKLVQRYASIFLSVIGDVRFDAKHGSVLMRQVMGGTIQDKGRLLNVFGEANLQVLQQLRRDDNQEDVFGTQPDDEKIASAILLDSNVDYITSTIFMRIKINTLAGDDIVFVVPATAPR